MATHKKIIFCLFVVGLCQAATGRNACALFYNLISLEQKVELDNPYTVRAGYENFILVVIGTGDLVFATVPHLSIDSHKTAINIVETHYETQVLLYLGAGELKRENNRYVAGNETSGTVSQIGRPFNQNSIKTVEAILRERAPELIDEHFVAYPFDVQNIHLHPRLNKIAVENAPGQKLINIRHDARNNLSVLLFFLAEIIGYETAKREGNPQASTFHSEDYEILVKNTEGIEAYLDLFGDTTGTHPRILVVQRWLQRIRNSERLALSEYKSLLMYLDSINQGLSSPGVRIVNLGKWKKKSE